MSAIIQKGWSFGAAATLVSGLTSGFVLAGGMAAAQTTITYATYFSANDPLVQVDRWFMDEVTERTGGNVTFETFYGGSMLGGPDIYPGLSRGAVGMGMSVPAAFQRDDYVLTNITLPYITDDSVATSFAFASLAQESDALQKEYGDQNVKLLYALGFSENVIWSNEPVRKVEDLEGMRIRSVMSVATALELLGAVPVQMAFGDSVGALQREVIDGFSSAPFLTSISVGVHEFAPYVSDAGGMGVYAVSSTSMNLDIWNSLSEADRATIEEVASEVPNHYASVLEPMVEESVAKLKEAGATEVIIMSEEEKQRFRDTVAQPIWDDWLAAADAAGHDGAAFLKRYRELVAEAEAELNYVPGLTRYTETYGE